MSAQQNERARRMRHDMKYRTMIHLNFSLDGNLQQNRQQVCIAEMRTIHLPQILVSHTCLETAPVPRIRSRECSSIRETAVLTAILFRRKVAPFRRYTKLIRGSAHVGA